MVLMLLRPANEQADGASGHEAAPGRGPVLDENVPGPRAAKPRSGAGVIDRPTASKGGLLHPGGRKGLRSNGFPPLIANATESRPGRLQQRAYREGVPAQRGFE